MFRAKALKRISSPEQLDSVVRAALPLQWLALIVLLAVVSAAVAWASIATVPTTVQAHGIYIPVGGLHPADTPAAGFITKLPALAVGNEVKAGEPLAIVTTPVARGASSPPLTYDVVAPLDGVVVDVYHLSGTYQTPGRTVGLVEPGGPGRPLVVYSYVSDAKASALHPGVAAQVTFGGVGSDYGYAEGVVSSVSQYPVDAESVQSVTANISLVKAVQALGPAKEVIVTLTPSSTPSGLTWARGEGPPGMLPPGLPIDVQFIVGSHHPISYVI
jgi:HlyD family secretion protein